MGLYTDEHYCSCTNHGRKMPIFTRKALQHSLLKLRVHTKSYISQNTHLTGIKNSLSISFLLFPPKPDCQAVRNIKVVTTRDFSTKYNRNVIT